MNVIPLLSKVDTKQLNKSLVWYRDNKVSEMNQEFNINSINTLYNGLNTLLDSLRQLCNEYGINIKSTVKGNLIQSHSNKITFPLAKSMEVRDINASMNAIEIGLDSFSVELESEVNRATETLVGAMEAAYGSDESGDYTAFNNFLSSARTEATTLLNSVDADIAQEAIATATEEANSATETAITEAKETAVAETYEGVSDEEAQAKMDDVNATWDNAKTGRDDPNPDYESAQSTVNERLEDLKEATDRLSAAAAAAKEAEAATKEAIAATKEAIDGLKSAQQAIEVIVSISGGKGFDPTTGQLVPGEYTTDKGTPYTITDNGDGTVTITNGGTTSTISNDIFSFNSFIEKSNEDIISSQQKATVARDNMLQADKAETEAAAALKEAKEEHDAAMKDYLNAAAEANGVPETNHIDDGSTTISVGDGNGGTVEVTFSDYEPDEE